MDSKALAQKIVTQLRETYPEAKVTFSEPLRSDGVWTIDVVRGSKWVYIEIHASGPMVGQVGVSNHSDHIEVGYGERVNEFISPDQVIQKVGGIIGG